MSARSEEALREASRRLAIPGRGRAAGAGLLADVGYTLGVGRKELGSGRPWSAKQA